MAKVIIIGGGVAGMSAAHELIERGFEVEVFERNPDYVGGKARSVDVPESDQTVPGRYLPGEHGFRFFPGFYAHVTDTMKRIPMGAGVSVMDNLVSTLTVLISQAENKPILVPVNFPRSLKDVKQLFSGFQAMSEELSEDDIAYFSGRVWRLMTSCQARFDQEYDSISWWDFTGAANRSPAYQKLLAGRPDAQPGGLQGPYCQHPHGGRHLSATDLPDAGSRRPAHRPRVERPHQRGLAHPLAPAPVE